MHRKAGYDSKPDRTQHDKAGAKPPLHESSTETVRGTKPPLENNRHLGREKKRSSPILASRALNEHDPLLIRMFRELMRAPMSTPRDRASERERQPRLDPDLLVRRGRQHPARVTRGVSMGVGVDVVVVGVVVGVVVRLGVEVRFGLGGVRATGGGGDGGGVEVQGGGGEWDGSGEGAKSGVAEETDARHCWWNY